MNPFPAPAEPFPHADLDGRPRAELNRLPAVAGRAATGAGPAERAIAALRKAWLCDDAGDVEYAQTQRAEAAWFLRMAIRDGSPMQGHLSADLALLAELLRRSGDCQGAIAVVRRGLAADASEGVGSLLLFQLQLAQAGDEGRHHIGEALAEA